MSPVQVDPSLYLKIFDFQKPAKTLPLSPGVVHPTSPLFRPRSYSVSDRYIRDVHNRDFYWVIDSGSIWKISCAKFGGPLWGVKRSQIYITTPRQSTLVGMPKFILHFAGELYLYRQIWL